MAHRVVYSKAYDSEVEYIKSNGYQYLDIGIIPKSRYRAICEYMPEKSSTKVMALFGQRTSVTTSNMFDVFMAFGKNCQINVQYAGNKSMLSVNNIPNTLHTIELGEKSYLDGNLLKTVTTTFNGAYTISIFAIHQNFSGSVNYNDRRMKDCRVYSFKLYNDSDTLIFEGIPVRIGSTGYMYDKVSKKLFGNKGTGNFILGQDVANPVPNIRRVFRFGNKRFVMPMPYESKIEYLESTGTQKINTGYYADSSITSFELNVGFSGDFNPRGGYTTTFIDSRDNDGSNKNFAMNFGGDVNGHHTVYNWFGLKYASGGTPFPYVVTFSDINKITYSNGIATFNDKKIVTEVIAGRRQRPLTILGTAATDTFTAYTARLYSFKITEGNRLILDLIPVRRGNVGYMYDRVSGKLFGNAGTGQFILGNDIN